MRILHCVSSMNPGGTERYLLRHIEELQSEYEHGLFVLEGNGSPLELSFQSLVSSFHCAEMKTIVQLPFVMKSYRKMLRDFDPDLIHCWSYFPAVLSLTGGSFTPLIWNMRQTLGELSDEKYMTRQAIRLLRGFCHRPDFWVYNASPVYESHKRAGLYSKHSEIIENGVDGSSFYRDDTAGVKLRLALGIPDRARVILSVGRRRPMKGETIFNEVVHRVIEERADVYVLVCGRSDEAGVQHPRVRYQEYVEDLRPYYSAAHLYLHASLHKEGFSNAIAEAMACGCLAVVTDTGHCARMLGDRGQLVSPGDAEEMYHAVMNSIDESCDRRLIRESILQHFPVERSHAAYRSLYQKIALSVAANEGICVESVS